MMEKIVRKLLTKQEAVASWVRQIDKKNDNWSEKSTSSFRTTIDRSSLPQFKVSDNGIKEFFPQFK